MDDRVVRDPDGARPGKGTAGRPGLRSPVDRDGKHRYSPRDGQAKRAGPEGLDGSVRSAASLGKDHQGFASVEEPYRLPRGPRIPGLEPHREGAQAPDHPAETRDIEEAVPCHVVHGPAHGYRHQGRISIRLVVRRDDDRAFGRNVVDSVEPEAEIGPAEGIEAGPREVENRSPHPATVHEAPRPQTGTANGGGFSARPRFHIA